MLLIILQYFVICLEILGNRFGLILYVGMCYILVYVLFNVNKTNEV
jgi:hypothetical protein